MAIEQAKIPRERDFNARVRHRIACEERGYPQSEACYSSTRQWEEATGMSWDVILQQEESDY